MLYKLGKVVSKTKNSLIFESNYNGYVINVNNSDIFELNKFQKIFIYIYWTEYKKILFGFKEFKERILFEDLISIQGVGPKIAMSILSNDWKNIINIIANGNYEELSKIPYVGQKASRQIIFELQKKYNTMVLNQNENKNKLEVYKTLKSLGFNDKQINSVSSKLKETNDIDEMIESAIEIISYEQKNESTNNVEA